MKPVKRSKLRLWAGKRYFMYRRYLEWMMSRKTFAEQTEQSPLKYLIFTHNTPLYRQVTDQQLVGERRSSGSQLYHYEVYEKDHRFTQEVWGGYARHNTIGRRAFALDGDLVADEVITENHALMMYSPLLTEVSSPVIVEHI
ncbi:hypothetical protein ACK8P5_03390 [Paenibacillus sp. EC2-1]|uniref:hypothetical protein n=1 Tax=Paenibacillus sp. EC2-1 TaxID=3388665 RepID=UPI003BEF0166